MTRPSRPTRSSKRRPLRLLDPDPAQSVTLIAALSTTIGQSVLLCLLLPSLMLDYGPFVMTGLIASNYLLSGLLVAAVQRLS